MNAVANIAPYLKSITPPAELQGLQSWLIWRYEHRDGDQKPRKVPYYPGGGPRRGQQGSSSDRAGMTTFNAALSAAMRRGFDGVGFALLPDHRLTVIDLDNCTEVMAEVEQLAGGTYAEFSPSGNGVHLFFKGGLGVYDDKKDSQGGAYGFETFVNKGFVTFTGNRLPTCALVGDSIEPVSQGVRDICVARFGASRYTETESIEGLAPPVGLTPAQVDECLAVLDADMAHDDWLHVGMALHHEMGDEGFGLWDAWSARGAKYPGEEALRRRWESFGRNAGKPVTARSLLKLANQNGARILDVPSLDGFEDVSRGVGDGKPPRFQVVPAGEFSRGPRPGWIIKGVLPRAELIVLFGESGSGKSFVALDLAASIARGVDWRGRRTRPGRVVYLAAEGGGGFRNRLKAYEQHHGVALDDIPFGIVHGVPNLLQKTDASDLAKAAVAFGPVDVVVVDTFAQVTAGANENAAEDIGRALAHCREIHKKTGATIMLIHHSGKDASKGARGWSGLRAAADAEIEVSRAPTGRKLRLSKQKDGEDGIEFGFSLDRVVIGVDEDGDEESSCVVVEAETPIIARPPRKLGIWEQTLVDVIQEFARVQTVGIEEQAIIAAAVARRPKPEGHESGRDSRKTIAARALRKLCEDTDMPYVSKDGCISIL
jgi:hypothetical protein